MQELSRRKLENKMKQVERKPSNKVRLTLRTGSYDKHNQHSSWLSCFQETHKNQAITLYYEHDFLTRRLEEMKFRTAEEIQVRRIISCVAWLNMIHLIENYQCEERGGQSEG